MRKILPIAILGLIAIFVAQGIESPRVVAQSLPTPTTGPTPTPVAHAVSWRLPFDGIVVVSNAAGEQRHIGASSEAIDYAPSPAVSMPVLAPADGVVIDFIGGDNDGFGNVLRINHPQTGTCSFFAHLADDFILANGTVVTQRQHVANSGNSGSGGSGFHLHFESRVSCTAGNVFSGTSIPVRPLMGNWWNPWYAPPAANATLTHDEALFSGAAQHPENNAWPTLMPAPANTQTPNPRHLSGNDSPPGFSSGYVSNITGTSVFVHMGAAPDAPNLSTDAYFRFFVFQGSTNQWWQLLPGNDVEKVVAVTSVAVLE